MRRLAAFLLAALLITAAVPTAMAAQTSAPPAAAGFLCPEPEARAFDFWIGEWDVLNRNRRPDGTRFYETGQATDRVYPVVGGCGVVEHWRGQAISGSIVGFSVRAYDPAAGEWTIVLLWPPLGQPAFGELRGGFRHGRGEFAFTRVLPSGDTTINRFTFSDIRPGSLRWENGTSMDGGASWATHWIMEFTRRDPLADSGLWNGSTMTTRRCPSESHRSFDGWLGEWAGVRTDAAADSTPVRAHLVRILEGCALMERVWSLDGSWEAFRVRAYEPRANRWVEYALDTGRRVLVRREDEPEDGIEFRDVAPEDGRWTRTRWTSGEDGAPGWIVEEATGPDGPWRLRFVFQFDRPVIEG